MSQQESLVQEGVERVNDAVESITGEFQRVQREVEKQLKARRRSLEKQLKSGRRDIERQTRKRVKRVQTELRKNPAVKRAQSVVSDAQKRVEKGVDALLATFQIASRSDLNRIDRKLNQISKKLRDLEQSRKANGSSLSA